jgi:hypothetical protein
LIRDDAGNGIAAAAFDIIARSAAKAPVSRKCNPDRDICRMIDRPLSNFDLDRAIALRWTLRDIVAKRLKLTPLKDDDLQTLMELGLVEMRDGVPVVTQSGLAALE